MLEEYEQEMQKLRQLNEMIKMKRREQEVAHINFSSDKKFDDSRDQSFDIQSSEKKKDVPSIDYGRKLVSSEQPAESFEDFMRSMMDRRRQEREVDSSENRDYNKGLSAIKEESEESVQKPSKQSRVSRVEDESNFEDLMASRLDQLYGTLTTNQEKSVV